jgi:hypothetical protein
VATDVPGYTPTTWVEGSAPGISAAQLKRIDDQVDDLSTEFNIHNGGIALDDHGLATSIKNGFMSSGDWTKLDGIEAGADVNPTDAEHLTAIKNVDGIGSGLDADLLDGLQGAIYSRRAHHGVIELRRSLDLTVGTGSVSEIGWDIEDRDDWGGHTGSNTFITDDAAGFYQAVAVVTFESHATGKRSIMISKNTSTQVAYMRAAAIDDGDASVLTCSWVGYLNGSQNLRVRVVHDAGVSIDILAGETTRFNIAKIGQP